MKLLKTFTRNAIYLTTGGGINIIDKIRLKLTSRYKAIDIGFFGKRLHITDSSSFVSMYEEIFIKGIYAFNAKSPAPLIIDCGANIGLSALYLKRLYPNAQLIAFEPDEGIFDILQKNISNAGYKDVDLRKMAVWINDEELTFASQGGLSGHIGDSTVDETPIKVKGFRLRNLLSQKIDLLKIDIEGAEYPVIKDCSDLLINVSNLFVEYHSTVDETQKLDELLRIFTEAGFRYQIQEAYTAQQPFIKVEPMLGMDLQLNIFCYR